MSRREERLERIRAAEREFEVNSIAVKNLGQKLRADPTALADRQLRQRDFQGCQDNLEATYFIRLFAEFEAGLREAWRSLVRNTSPPTQVLLDSMAARFFIPLDWLARAHHVRRYRNSLVHESEEEVAAVSLDDARGHLCRFVSRLPRNW